MNLILEWITTDYKIPHSMNEDEPDVLHKKNTLAEAGKTSVGTFH
jgi:hypothetical protein